MEIGAVTEAHDSPSLWTNRLNIRDSEANQAILQKKTTRGIRGHLSAQDYVIRLLNSHVEITRGIASE